LASEVDEITGIMSSDCMRSLMIELLDNSHSCREFALYWYTSVVNTEAPRAPEIVIKNKHLQTFKEVATIAIFQQQAITITKKPLTTKISRTTNTLVMTKICNSNETLIIRMLYTLVTTLKTRSIAQKDSY
jgi:hypothetical protein